MSTQIIEDLISRATSRTRTKHSEGCVGEYVGRINLRYRCWVATGSVRELFYAEIKQKILRHLDGWSASFSSDEFVILSVYMIGRSESTAVPTVCFLSENAQARKEARNEVKRSSIMKQHPEFMTAHMAKDPGWGSALEQLAGTESLDPGTKSEHPVTEVLQVKSKPLRTVGFPIYIQHPMQLRGAVANEIKLQGKTYYLTCSHVFFSEPKQEPPNSTETDEDFEIDGDSETGSEEELEASITSAGSCSSDSWTTEHGSSEDEQFSVSPTVKSEASVSTLGQDIETLKIEEATAAEAQSESTGQFTSAKTKYNVTSKDVVGDLAIFGRLKYWSVDADWALIEPLVADSKESTPNRATFRKDPNFIEPVIPTAENTSIVTHTASRGRTLGTLARSLSCIKVPRGKSFQDVFSVKLVQPLAEGDCGSAVHEQSSGRFFGHIIAGCRGGRFAYVIAAYRTLPDMKAAIQNDRTVPIHLPIESNAAPAEQPFDPKLTSIREAFLGPLFVGESSGKRAIISPILASTAPGVGQESVNRAPALEALSSASLESLTTRSAAVWEDLQVVRPQSQSSLIFGILFRRYHEFHDLLVQLKEGMMYYRDPLPFPCTFTAELERCEKVAHRYRHAQGTAGTSSDAYYGESGALAISLSNVIRTLRMCTFFIRLYGTFEQCSMTPLTSNRRLNLDVVKREQRLLSEWFPITPSRLPQPAGDTKADRSTQQRTLSSDAGQKLFEDWNDFAQALKDEIEGLESSTALVYRSREMVTMLYRLMRETEDAITIQESRIRGAENHKIYPLRHGSPLGLNLDDILSPLSFGSSGESGSRLSGSTLGDRLSRDSGRGQMKYLNDKVSYQGQQAGKAAILRPNVHEADSAKILNIERDQNDTLYERSSKWGTE